MFAKRRETFMGRMQGGVAVIPNARPAVRSNDVHYKFRVDNDFYYLSGFDEPHSVLLLCPEHPEHRVVLFVQPKNPNEELWAGWRAGVEGARDHYKADAAYPIDDLETQLKEYLRNVHTLYFAMGRDAVYDAMIGRLIEHYRAQRRTGEFGPRQVLDPFELVHEMRLFKDAAELESMRQAVTISIEAHRAAMRTVQPGMREHQLEAIIEYCFRSRGAIGPGYPTIVGSGKNATILHYIDNEAEIGAQELVLIDAGAESHYYTADITRTFPASGAFTAPQRAVYEVVLRAQLDAIAMVKPGVRFNEVHERAIRTLTEGLVELDILAGTVDTLIGEFAYRRFYMHRTSHWLGLDVHDAGKYKIDDEWRRLEPGMVLTVEPGLYIPAGAEGVEPQFSGIGVRIEDDVLVTDDGHEVLSAALEKEPEAIEALMRSDKESAVPD